MRAVFLCTEQLGRAAWNDAAAWGARVTGGPLGALGFGRYCCIVFALPHATDVRRLSCRRPYVLNSFGVQCVAWAE